MLPVIYMLATMAIYLWIDMVKDLIQHPLPWK